MGLTAATTGAAAATSTFHSKRLLFGHADGDGDETQDSQTKTSKHKRKCRVCADTPSTLSILETIYSTKEGEMRSFRAVQASTTPTAGHAKLGVDSSSTTKPPTSPQSGGRRCPPTYQELGNSTWLYLHTMAAYYPERPPLDLERSMPSFFRTFAAVFPCEHCREHMLEYISEHPVDASSNEALSMWVCRFHNAVNANLGKPQWSCDANELIMRYRDGPEDGSCD